jgi:predicted TIM-barrel fold metal-dependent hydrolase
VIADVLNMISHGLFDKYPDLEVVMQEGGTMWIPFIAQRADELYNVYHGDIELTERAFNQGQEYLQHNPSYYLFNNMYVTTQPIALPSKSSHIGPMMDLCRAKDMFMFSTDWPHLTVDTANWVFEHSTINEDLKKNILHKNAEQVLRLPDK